MAVRRGYERFPTTRHASHRLFSRLLTLIIFGNTAASVYAEPEQVPVGALESGGALELILGAIENSALGQTPGDNVRTTKQEIQLQGAYRASARLSALGEIKWQGEQQVFGAETQRSSEYEWERGEAWLYWQGLFDDRAAIKIGRQNFTEPRRWWWDDDLDALRFDYAHDAWHLMLGGAQALTRKSSREDFIDPDDEDVLRALGHVDWQLSPARRFSAFYLYQRDESARPPLDSLVATARTDTSDAALHWIGLRIAGDVRLRSARAVTYWADLATVTGDETLFEYANEGGGASRVAAHRQQRVRGRAVDSGLSYRPAAARGLALALSHAWGSGDENDDDDVDKSFRQTQLQDPTQEFRYYGELLRPELSNLAITTALVGLAITPATRLTVGYHRFRQVHAATSLRNTRIDLHPSGQDRDIGREISLLVEIQEWKRVDAVVAAASFEAGRAFGAAAGRRINSVFIEFVYEF